MQRNILICGAGGAGRELAFTLSLDKNPDTAWEVKGFIDDTEKLSGSMVNSIPVVGGFDYLNNYSGNIAVTIFDDPVVRYNLISKIKKNDKILFPVLISSTSLISQYVELGEGCIVNSNNFISVNIKFGDFVFVDGGNRIGHDAEIDNYTTLFSGILIGGGVSIGKKCVIGSGATILPKVTIGDGSIIGGGSLVSKDIPSGVVAAGVPAKILREIK